MLRGQLADRRQAIVGRLGQDLLSTILGQAIEPVVVSPKDPEVLVRCWGTSCVICRSTSRMACCFSGVNSRLNFCKL